MSLRKIKLKDTDETGWFHKLGIGKETTVDNKTVSVSIAIVEKENGDMVSVNPNNIKFLEPSL